MSSEDDDRKVACPACQVPAGEPCTAPTEKGRRPVTWTHSARTEARKGGRIGSKDMRVGDTVRHVHRPELDWRRVAEVGARGIRLELPGGPSTLLLKSNYRVAIEAPEEDGEA